MADTHVIIGGGLAGAKAAEALREEGFDGRVVLIGDEHEQPYERPPLSKEYLRGEAPREKAHVHAPGFYYDHAIELRTGTTAERIVGLSKLARVVDHFARNLQVQERLTKQVAGWLERELQPKGVGVVIEAEHMCMTLRGTAKPGARTVTSALTGLVRDDSRTRQEFLALTGGTRNG